VNLADDADRTRAAKETSSSFLVEASAGTGKTRTLIERIRCLVIDRGVPLGRIAAMTFTEKAAGEMKTRLRLAIEEARNAPEDSERRSRAERARIDLDVAEISTIHSFCARLLRERPVEAGVDPDFASGDELLAADLAEEAFAAWFDREARRAEGPVADALRAGAHPAALHDLATELYEERLVLDRATLPADAAGEIRELCRRLLGTYGPLVSLLSSKEEEKRKERVLEVLGGLKTLLGLPDDELPAFRPDLSIELRGRWPQEVKDVISSSRDDIALLDGLLCSLPLVPTLTALVGQIRESFFPEIEAMKRQRGILDFDDLLLRARDLLRNSPAARAHFHQRIDALVVDEFQDTDPVQAEIVMRLSAPPAPQGDDWTALSPEGGRLFLVGDPKQSIYRFRRADVETYGAARGRFADVLKLTTNFRASAPLLAFANAIGPALLPSRERAAPWNVPYSGFSQGPETKSSPSPGVLFLAPPEPVAAPGRGQPGDDGNGDDEEQLKVNEQEARAVANLLLSRFAAGERPWSRIAVLVPRHAAIDHLQRAFREAGIPFLLEGGKSFYKREEVAAVVAALSAIDDPGDAVSVVAALKSVLFGASDLELLDAAESGLRFDDLAAFPVSSPLRPAADLLLRLHRRRHERPLAATLGDLLDSTQAFAAVEIGAVVNPLQAAANLERLLVLARDLDREQLSFRSAVARLRRRMEEDGPEPAAREEEGDAVRLMTLHKAKGLEFPIVVLADLGLKEQERRGPRASVLCERAGGRYGVRLRFGARMVGTARWTEVERGDGERQEAETRRLLYVGLTRAKERLVVSWFRKRRVLKSGELSDFLEKSLLAPLARFETPAGDLESLVEVVGADLSPASPARAAAEAAATIDLAAEMAAAAARLGRARTTASRPLRRAGEKEAGSVPRHEDVEPADREDAANRARRIGVAVHAAMEILLGGEAPPGPAAVPRTLGVVGDDLFEEERTEAATLVDALLSTDAVSRAFVARRRFTELPLLYVDASSPDRPLVEGKIDLLFEEADGWQIVDWKTDHVPDAAARATREALYAPQLRAYEEGVRRVLGPGARVKPGLLVFARGRG
jgi:ATP-dependent helicase/nuclease subunit A